MPIVTQHLETIFGRKPVCYLNPDEVVALGAALYCGARTGVSGLNAAQTSAVTSMNLQEVAHHYYGTVILDTEHASGARTRVANVIAKNAPIPCTASETYYTVREGQEAVDCSVTQSSTRESDPDFVRVIWQGQLGPLPPNRPAEQEVKVSFSYDANQIMRCSFTDVATGLLAGG